MMSPRAEFLIQTVLSALDTLCRETDLSPRNAIINNTLGNLVETLSKAYQESEEQEVLCDARVAEMRPRLLEKLSRAEGEMEKYWADHFLSRPDLDYGDLQDFWYWGCYEALVDKELACLPANSCTESRNAVFVGAGALPLTAIILHAKTGMPVTCVDSDPEACRMAEALLKKLGMTEIRVMCADGDELNYNRYDTVLIASLVPQPAKESIIAEIRNSKTDTFLAVRSAERLHTILYDPFDDHCTAVSACKVIGKTAYDPAVINTTLVYQSRSARQNPLPAP